MQSDFHVKACQVKNSHGGMHRHHPPPPRRHLHIDSRGTARQQRQQAQPGSGCTPHAAAAAGSGGRHSQAAAAAVWPPQPRRGGACAGHPGLQAGPAHNTKAVVNSSNLSGWAPVSASLPGEFFEGELLGVRSSDDLLLRIYSIK